MNAFLDALRAVGEAARGKEQQLRAYADQVRFYNRKLNLVASGETGHLLTHHVAHCMRLGVRRFAPASTVIDWGTGGGMPLIPLAILFPEVHFVGVDAVEKKVLAVRQIARQLALPNVEVIASRAENVHIPHVYSVSRATAPLADLWKWHVQDQVTCTTGEDEWPAGLVCLKGGALGDEMADLHRSVAVNVYEEAVGYDDPYYGAKKVVVVTARESLGATGDHS